MISNEELKKLPRSITVGIFDKCYKTFPFMAFPLADSSLFLFVRKYCCILELIWPTISFWISAEKNVYFSSWKKERIAILFCYFTVFIHNWRYGNSIWFACFLWLIHIFKSIDTPVLLFNLFEFCLIYCWLVQWSISTILVMISGASIIYHACYNILQAISPLG